MNVFEFGSGPPVLLLHGYPQSHQCWRKIIPLLEHKRTIYAPAWFGWGSSERSLSLSLRYEDEFPRIGKLLALLNIDGVDLVGHDYGGLLSLAYAAHNPIRIRSLALINTRAHGKIGFWTRQLLNSMVGLAQYSLTRSCIPYLPLKNGSFTANELNEYLAFLDSAHGRRSFAHFYRHFRTTPRRELADMAAYFDFPVAVIWGDQDRYFPFSIGRDLSARLRNCKLTRIPGGGHFAPEEHPEQVAAAILEILR